MSAVALILAAYVLARWTDRAVNDIGVRPYLVGLASVGSHLLFLLGVLVALGVVR